MNYIKRILYHRIQLYFYFYIYQKLLLIHLLFDNPHIPLIKHYLFHAHSCIHKIIKFYFIIFYFHFLIISLHNGHIISLDIIILLLLLSISFEPFSKTLIDIIFLFLSKEFANSLKVD